MKTDAGTLQPVLFNLKNQVTSVLVWLGMPCVLDGTYQVMRIAFTSQTTNIHNFIAITSQLVQVN
jgi:hypothetical protein